MAEKVPLRQPHGNRRKLVLCLLLLMILVNIAVRYPTDHAIPYGSDTYAILELSRELVNGGHASWTLTPMSYFGLYPLSYPSGIPFSVAELRVLTGVNWNSIPLAFSLFFSTLFVLAGFVFFRQFRVGDELAALLAGLMTFSPIFIYFTYEEVSGRGFVLPLFLLSVFLIFWSQGRMWKRILLFLLLTIGLFSMHRTSFMILLMESAAAAVMLFGPYLPRIRPSAKATVYASMLVIGILFVVWPFVPGLREVFREIPEVAFSYRMGEWQFSSGLLFAGNSLAVLLANLAANYVGSMGLALLLLPIGFIALYPTSRDSLERDIFPLVSLTAFAPMIWQADYMQLVLLPFAYLLAGLAIRRRNRIKAMILKAKRRLRPRSSGKAVIPDNLWSASLAIFLTACMVFSAFLFVHRMNIQEQPTDIKNWPTDSEVNTGLYLGSSQGVDHKNFVSASEYLDRRVRWFSGWQSPVCDAVVLESSGYLNATSNDFSMSMEKSSYLRYMFAFFDFKGFYELNADVVNRNLYHLSFDDVYGFFRLYYLTWNTTYTIPRISTSQAGISVVIEINSMGDATHNLYIGVGALKSAFLKEVSSKAYIIFENDAHTAFLAADPRSV